jgi:signal peptidase I
MGSAAPRPPRRRKTNPIVEAAWIAGMVLLVVAARVFAFQPYTIPSASEEPNLLHGDYIIVAKYSYGWSKHSIPFSPPLFTGRVFFHAPERGDIVVFKLPRRLDGRIDYVKRLVGLPGDRIQLKNGVVYVNDQPIPRTPLAPEMGDLSNGYQPVQRFMETASNGREYVIQKAEGGGAADDTGVYVVPAHCYFMMGDNRDNSLDSRFDPAMPPEASGSATCGWDEALDQYLPRESGVGFVPEEDLIGKAVLILFSWGPGPAASDAGGGFTGLRPNRFVRPVT